MKKRLSPNPIIHKCKDGRLVCLNYHNPYGRDIPKMEDSHLLNTIAYIKKRAKEGVTIGLGGMGVDIEEMWYDEDIVYGKEAKEYLNYKAYKNEAIKRNLL